MMASSAGWVGGAKLDVSGARDQRAIAQHDEMCRFGASQLATLGEALQSLERQQRLYQAGEQVDDAHL